MNVSNNITFQPLGRRTSLPSGSSLLDAARSCGIDIVSICGGIGACNSCRIRLVSGTLSPPTLEEQTAFTPDEILQGYRLACQSFPQSDVIIDIPSESLTTPQRLQIEGQLFQFDIDPLFNILDIVITPPDINDLTSDLSRVKNQISSHTKINSVEIEYRDLVPILETLRENNWHVIMAMRNSRAITAFPPVENLSTFYTLGLAVDIGTTKLATYLVDLNSGKTLAKAGDMNPQIAFGEDVISRIAYTNTHTVVHDNSGAVISGRKFLQLMVVNAINDLIDNMIVECNNSGIPVSNNHIIDAVVVGNTAMHHLFAGLPVAQLGVSPYVAAVSEALEIPSHDIGLNINPAASIFMPPNVAGYVGADHIAMLLASVFNSNHGNNSKNIIALDIGTNTEISLITPHDHLCCSCASGPAFEGAHILFGMRAANGAVERVQIIDNTVRIKTINDAPPVGICGSGILDAISEMRASNIIDSRGVFSLTHPLVRFANGQNEFILMRSDKTGHGKDIVITRKDITEIQLAKGAIRTGIDILLKEAGLHSESIDLFIVAGAFGTYIDIQAALRIGMFPDIPKQRFIQVGNAAGAGARQMLLSKSKRAFSSDIAKQIRYIELSNHKYFSSRFSQTIFL